MKTTARILLIRALGLGLGFGRWQMVDLGYFQQWERLSTHSGLLFSGFGLLIGVDIALLAKGPKLYLGGTRTKNR